MSDIIASESQFSLLQTVKRIDKAIMAMVLVLILLIAFDSPQTVESLIFLVGSLINVSPFLLASILIAAYATASGADNLIARAFSGRELPMVGAASLVGALSPFCSCGVIPLIAALLAMGVPLAPVMAFWLASPVMDPTMFVLTAGTIGTEFAIVKTISAIGIGLFGGYATYVLVHRSIITTPLREGVGDGGCGGSTVREVKPVVWKFWSEKERVQKFSSSGLKNLFFLGKWLALAYLLESLMIAYVPDGFVRSIAGENGLLPIIGATIVGIPAYLNGYAALPLVGGLIEQGMSPSAGLAFLVAGGVTSIPAAIAVFALARIPVFVSYVLFAIIGAATSGILYQVYLNF